MAPPLDTRPARKQAPAHSRSPVLVDEDKDAQRDDPMTTRMLELQRMAGNQAVAGAFGARGAVQAGAGGAKTARPAQQAPASSAVAQVGAVWEKTVVVPLAKAADKIGRDQPNLEGARADLVGALQMIRILCDATPADDPNRDRIKVVERLVQGVLDVVDNRLRRGKSDQKIGDDLMALRLEADRLAPTLTHRPGTGDIPAPQIFRDLVVDELWNVQREISAGKTDNAHWAVSRVALMVGRFREATPEQDPARSRLGALAAGVISTSNLLSDRRPAELGTHDLADQAATAWDVAKGIGNALVGKPVPTEGDESANAEAEIQAAPSEEPDFTWESRDPAAALVNDTLLMRPDGSMETDRPGVAGPKSRSRR